MKLTSKSFTYLEDYVYEKIWSERSQKDQAVLAAMSSASSGKVDNIRGQVGMSSNSFTTYRSRLMRKGLIISPSYGTLRFALPRFREFVRRQMFLSVE